MHPFSWTNLKYVAIYPSNVSFIKMLDGTNNNDFTVKRIFRNYMFFSRKSNVLMKHISYLALKWAFIIFNILNMIYLLMELQDPNYVSITYHWNLLYLANNGVFELLQYNFQSFLSGFFQHVSPFWLSRSIRSLPLLGHPVPIRVKN